MLLAIQAESLEAIKLTPEMSECVLTAHARTEEIMAGFLRVGIERGDVMPIDVVMTSHIIVEKLHAFEQCIKSKSAIIKTNDMDELFDKQRAIIQLLVNGIKNSKWKNKF